MAVYSRIYCEFDEASCSGFDVDPLLGTPGLGSSLVEKTCRQGLLEGAIGCD
jgi:hypothetical protein